MRATDLLRCTVVDARGASCGPVRDVRLRRRPDGRFDVTGLVVGDGRLARLAHSLGVTDGRVGGPWLLRWLVSDAAREARWISAGDVGSWEEGEVRLRVASSDLPRFQRREVQP